MTGNVPVARAIVLAALLPLAALGVSAGPAAAAGGFVVTKPPKKATPNQNTLRIGWFYTDEEFTGEHLDRLKLNWPGCAKAGGQYVDFPDGVHVYPFREPPGPKTHARFLQFRGAFYSQLYIGAAAKPGKVKMKLRCLGPHKVFLGAGSLTMNFVRKPINFHIGDLPQTLITPDLFAGMTSDPSLTNFSIPSCSETSIRTVAIETPALAGTHASTLSRQTAPGVEDGGSFEAALTGSVEVPPGEYPINISCGSGPIGSGTIRLRPASSPF